jgi:uncharacterized protein
MPDSNNRSAGVARLLPAAVVYMALMAAGWIVNPYDYGTVSNLFYQTPFLLLAIVYAYTLLTYYRIPVGRAGRFKAPAALWVVLLIVAMNAASLVYALSTGFAGHRTAFAGVLVATMMVGFAEEGMYRGFLLSSLARKMSIGRALIVSSLMFGLLHGVNVLAHASVTAVLVQMAFTVFVGYALGTVYIKSGGNLVLVAVLHGLYDFAVFSADYATTTGGKPLPLIGVLTISAWVVLSLALFVSSGRPLPELPGAQTGAPPD